MRGLPFAGRIFLLALLAFGARLATAQTYEGRELVRAELLADTTAVIPGKPFTAGLWLRMAPGWHTYWKFPGDAGIPTELKWNVPSGWKIGEIQWPIPLKMTEPGDIQIYGYRDEVLLLQEVIPPASVVGQNLELAAEATWLVCEKICIPGGAKLHLSLPVSSTADRANEETFARFRSAIPQPWPAGGVASAAWKRQGNELELTLKSAVLQNHSAVDFYPLPEPNVVVGHTKKEVSPDAILFRVPIETTDTNVAALNGVVVFGQADGTAARNAWIVPKNDGEATLRGASSTGSAESRPTAGTIAKFLLFGFIGGFILNLMPCVLPVISLKIFGFIQHAGQSRRRILRSGLAFTAGIFAWFIGLAIVLIALKAAGREITWAFQFTNPTFVLAMSAVVLVFALNLFGVFEIALPQRASRGVLGWTAKEGDAGSFFQGVFATVLATPCTAPFLGAALGFAFTQSSFLILAMFLAIAAGMSLPYVLLSAQPAWLRLLPKPGAWMVRVKQLMGFLLLATLMFLLWVLAVERGADAVIWSGCFLLAVSLACWIKGSFITPIASRTTRLVAVLAIVIVLAASASFFVGNKFASARRLAGTPEPGGDWQAFTPDRLASELAQGHTVFVDFTAAWCVTCKFNETAVLESSAVRQAFQRRGVIKMKADWTNADPVITKILKHFGRPGVPLYVLYPPEKNAEPFVFPELLTKAMVLNQIEPQRAANRVIPSEVEGPRRDITSN
ncbi:MAG: thioredoxin family protein [Verrucomicrobiota bacterium]|nr:thioredoxin family protein [Verrucomicrobiota bacterium]